jgi:hypothetical protein
MAAKNSSRQGGKSTDNNGPKRDKTSRRNVIVMAGLLSSLSLTSVLLLALAPAPLRPNGTVPLLQSEQYETIFATRVPFSEHWRYVYVHHSRTRGASGNESGDHFVINNGGDGAVDGMIEMTPVWMSQQPARPTGAQLSHDCISICIVGDFDLIKPTEAQVANLAALVQSLQSRLHIPADAVMLSDAPASPAGIGRNFPKAAFGQRLLP